MARLTPQQKKRLAYERDHQVQSHHPHLFRKGWPRRKALASRRERRRADRLVEGLNNRPADAVLEDADMEGLTAAYIRDARTATGLWRHRVLTLRERVEDRKNKRLWASAVGMFSQVYDSALHRAPFGAYLATLVSGAGEGSREMASFLADVLDPDPRHDIMDWRRRRRGDWLRTFLRDEPEWEPRLREWIDRMLEEGA